MPEPITSLKLTKPIVTILKTFKNGNALSPASSIVMRPIGSPVSQILNMDSWFVDEVYNHVLAIPFNTESVTSPKPVDVHFFFYFVNYITVHITFQKGGGGHQRTTELESWPMVVVFEPATFTFKLHNLVRLTQSFITLGRAATLRSRTLGNSLELCLTWWFSVNWHLHVTTYNITHQIRLSFRVAPISLFLPMTI